MTFRQARAAFVIGAALLACSSRISAHVGSPDIFLDTQAGPYHLLVTVTPPYAIPGVADVQILATTPDVRSIAIVPTPLTGAGARFTPAPDRAEPSKDQPQLYTGHLWLMTAGAWEIRITAEGALGTGTVAVPVPTLPQATLQMDRGLGAVLLVLMLVLCAGWVGIVSAIARESALAPGEVPAGRAQRRGRIAGGVTAIVAAVIVLLGRAWWGNEASRYARYVYKPLEATASVSDAGILRLALFDPGWIPLRRLDDFVPDHGHLMHLFVVSRSLDRLWHLHPAQADGPTFDQALPELPDGPYEFFADVVHATGIDETVTGTIASTHVAGHALAGDDSVWDGTAEPAASDGVARLPDGGRMTWIRDATPLRTRQLTRFTFRIDDRSGQPARDLEPYMGMAGHAIFVRRDRQVFAHVHPFGSAPMAALAISARSLGPAADAGMMSAEDMVSMAGHATAHDLPATVSFPYGFPSAGDYRVFVQVKRAGRIETGAFDAHVE